MHSPQTQAPKRKSRYRRRALMQSPLQTQEWMQVQKRRCRRRALMQPPLQTQEWMQVQKRWCRRWVQMTKLRHRKRALKTPHQKLKQA